MPAAERYVPYGRDIPPQEFARPDNRVAHGLALRDALTAASTEGQHRRAASPVTVEGAIPGIYVQFEGVPGVPLNLASLEDRGQGISLQNVTNTSQPEHPEVSVERATVFVPEGKIGHFLSRFEKYAQETARRKGERRYEDMLDRVATLRLATLRALWTDPEDEYPTGDEPIWWEVWLRRRLEGREVDRFRAFADGLPIELGDRWIGFEDRIVGLAHARAADLALSVDVLDDLAELRRARETAAFFEEMDAREQADWIEDLLGRTAFAPADAPSVCVLDTGVNRGHVLLEQALAPEDCHACDPAWGSSDDDGHGTEMAGLALYGDLVPLLAGAQPLALRHILESVKVLPPRGANRPELYGAITAEAASRVEIQAPRRRRTFSMAVTATDQRSAGQPTSWSAAIDALAVGQAVDVSPDGLAILDDSGQAQRLFVLCAGNVDPLEVGHLDRSDLAPVQDPGQAWNALTIGAYTEKAAIQHPDWAGWRPIAPPGDLSPWSRTSVAFPEAWPIKPDVVLEGGNAACDAGDNVAVGCEDLSLLTTGANPTVRPLTLSWATSAATAQAARMATQVAAEYPDLWPESVRGLLVHSARWTRAMRTHLRGASGKRGRARLVRRYGFGVPSLERASRSANDAVTLVSQAEIRPFANGVMREMHLYRLPWPVEVLEELGESNARLRVTLSYFIAPNPGRRGWRERHRYASHGLRFEVKAPTESIEDFRKRLNREALEGDERRPSVGGGAMEWYLGEQSRNKGSVHSDILEGFAANLAECGVIGVIPVSGWWKDQPTRDRSDDGVRYSLIVSIETDAEGVDLWTPIATEAGVPIEVEA